MAIQFRAPSSSSSSSSIQSWTYHVFLSFRGEDTRNTFTRHLHSNLVQNVIRTFIDDGLTRGEGISSTLFIVFSEKYAFSKWCLEELVKIMQCNESKQQIVYPVFYKVDLSHVRNQTDSFGQAIPYHDDTEKMAQWKRALTKAGNFSGWHFSQGGINEGVGMLSTQDEIRSQVVYMDRLGTFLMLISSFKELK